MSDDFCNLQYSACVKPFKTQLKATCANKKTCSCVQILPPALAPSSVIQDFINKFRAISFYYAIFGTIFTTNRILMTLLKSGNKINTVKPQKNWYLRVIVFLKQRNNLNYSRVLDWYNTSKNLSVTLPKVGAKFSRCEGKFGQIFIIIPYFLPSEQVCENKTWTFKGYNMWK